MALGGGCSEAGVGLPPPNDQIFFPSGLAVDPRLEEVSSADGSRSWPAPPRWLFVANANSDLVYNGATVTAVDLDAFFSAWQEAPILSTAAIVDDRRPTTSGAVRDDVPDIGAEVDRQRPCRRNAFRPQVVECTEEPFVASDETVHLGSFTTQIWPYRQATGGWRLLVPVRADPSVAYIDFGGGLDPGDPLRLRCGADDAALDPRSCSKGQRMRHLRNNPDYRRIGREPTNILLTQLREEDGQGGAELVDLGFLTHSEVPEVTLLGLGGLYDEGNRGQPAIVDIQTLISEQAFVGSYGIAERPCVPRGDLATCAGERGTCLAEGEDAAICDAAYSACVEGNEPAYTLGCTRPLIYVAHRQSEFILRLTVERAVAEPPFRCVSAAELEAGAAGGILCEHRLVAIDQFVGVGVDVAESAAGGFGDIAFSRDGNSLYVVRNRVGGLIRIDTSVDERGETRDTPASLVEVCAGPSAMVVLGDATSEYAAVSCYRSGVVFVVDLQAFRVVEQIFVGAGPHSMTVDNARDYLYVGNSLDATISVVDLGLHRRTRFTEVARIGLQEPYSG